ncbi:MAG: hypothetical protein PWR09_559 [Archaeoglobi archaeon]|nr:hypothetical protein [Archaeoglobi archaeon]
MCMDCGEHGIKSRNFENFRRIMKALHCPTRWMIIECLKDGAKSTKEILDCLLKKDEAITLTGLYYHLSELRNAGIIEIAGYKEEGGGAPQKVWRLKVRKVEISLVNEDECN